MAWRAGQDTCVGGFWRLPPWGSLHALPASPVVIPGDFIHLNREAGSLGSGEKRIVLGCQLSPLAAVDVLLSLSFLIDKMDVMPALFLGLW